MMQKLRESGALKSVDRKLLVTDIDFIRENIIY
jgi:hypothetical protein